MKKRQFDNFLGGGILASTNQFNITGCTDDQASNYDPAATVDDGSCIPCVFGCPFPLMSNYDPNATCNDGSCIPYIQGCMDPTMYNYDPTATQCLSTENCYCVPFIYGCPDPNAINYDCATALNPPSNYQGDPSIANGQWQACFDGVNTDDGSCIPAVYGCLNSNASNYDPLANMPDFCVYPSYQCGVLADGSTGSTVGGTPMMLIYADVSNATSTSIDVNWNSLFMNQWTSYSGSGAIWNFNYEINSFDLEYKESSSNNYITWGTSVNFPVTVSNLQPSTSYDFRIVINCTSLFVNYQGNNPVFVHTQSLPGYSAGMFPPNEAGISTLPAAVISGCTDPLAVNYDVNANLDDGSCDYSGCTDPLATNYNSQATIDDGSCVYPAVYGCMDPNYIQGMNPGYAIPQGSMPTTPCNSSDPNQAGLWGACDGNITNGFNQYPPGGDNCCCNNWTIYGCMDESALNYNPNAHVSCTDSTDPNQNNYGNVPCDECIFTSSAVLGCTDSTDASVVSVMGVWQDNAGFCVDGTGPFTTWINGGTPECNNNNGYLAANYNPLATQDDGSCHYPVYNCTDPTACNYDSSAEFNIFNACDFTCNPPTNVVVAAGVDSTTQAVVSYQPPFGSCFTSIRVKYKVSGTNNQIVLDNYVNGSQISGLTPGTMYDFRVDAFCSVVGIYSSVVLSTFFTDSTVIQGCTDPLASNYDPTATADDGSCLYTIVGCTDPNASNYDPTANSGDPATLCLYNGCTDSLAINYDPNANNDDGSCTYCPDLHGLTGQTHIDGSVANNQQAPTPITNGRLSYHSPYTSNGGQAVGIKVSLGNIFDVNFDGNDPNSSFAQLGVKNISVMLGENGAVADPQNAPFDAYGTGNFALNVGKWIGTSPVNLFNSNMYFGTQGNISMGGLKGATTYFMHIMTHCDTIPTASTTSIPSQSQISSVPVQFTTPHLYGCTDPNATNYDTWATADDGSCVSASLGCATTDAVMPGQPQGGFWENSNWLALPSIVGGNLPDVGHGFSFNTAGTSADDPLTYLFGPQMKIINQDNGNCVTNYPSVDKFSIYAVDLSTMVNYNGDFIGSNPFNDFQPGNPRATKRTLFNVDGTGPFWFNENITNTAPNYTIVPSSDADAFSYSTAISNGSQNFPITNPTIQTWQQEWVYTTTGSANSGVKSLQYGPNTGSHSSQVNQTPPKRGGFSGHNPNVGASYKFDAVGYQNLPLAGCNLETDRVKNLAHRGTWRGAFGARSGAAVYCIEPICNNIPGAGEYIGDATQCKGYWPLPAPCGTPIDPQLTPVGVNETLMTKFGSYNSAESQGAGAAAAGADNVNVAIDFHVTIGCNWGAYQNLEGFKFLRNYQTPNVQHAGAVYVRFHPQHFPGMNDFNIDDWSATADWNDPAYYFEVGSDPYPSNNNITQYHHMFKDSDARITDAVNDLYQAGDTVKMYPNKRGGSLASSPTSNVHPYSGNFMLRGGGGCSIQFPMYIPLNFIGGSNFVFPNNPYNGQGMSQDYSDWVNNNMTADEIWTNITNTTEVIGLRFNGQASNLSIAKKICYQSGGTSVTASNSTSYDIRYGAIHPGSFNNNHPNIIQPKNIHANFN